MAIEDEITYGALVIGGSGTDYELDGPIKLFESPDKAVVEFQFMYSGATVAAFQTKDDAVRAAFLKSRMNFLWKIGATTHRSYSHTGRTGMDAEPEITLDEDPGNSGTSRVLGIRITFSLPFAGSAVGGEDDVARKGVSYEHDRGPSNEQLVRITGVYTANASTTSATAMYAAKVGALATAYLGTLTGTFKLTRNVSERNDQDTEISFTREYEELLASEAGWPSHAALGKQTLLASIEKAAPGDADAATKRVAVVTLNYMGHVDKTSSTDLQSIWESSVRPWMIDTAIAAYQSGTPAVTLERPSFNADRNIISAEIVAEVIVSGAILESELIVEDDYDPGERLARPRDGNPDSGRPYQDHRERIRTITFYVKQLRGGAAAAGGGAGANAGGVANIPGVSSSGPAYADFRQAPDPFGFNSMSKIVKRLQSKWKPSSIGIEGKQIAVEEITTVDQWQFYQGTTATQQGGTFATVDAHPEISGRRSGS